MFKTKAIFTCDECAKTVEMFGEQDAEQLLGWYVISEAYQEGEQDSKHYCSAACARRALGG